MQSKLFDFLYRKKVLGIVVDNNDYFLLVKLRNYKDNEWNFAGGGVEKKETEEQALFRELKEELGTSSFEIIRKSKTLSKYNWPLPVIAKKCFNNRGIWLGQIVRCFLVKFAGDRNQINFDLNEIKQIKWVKRQDLKKYLMFKNQFEAIVSEIE